MAHRHWHRGCKLDVCTQDAKAKDGELENCQEVPQEGEPGPTEITLPPSPHTNVYVHVLPSQHCVYASCKLI